MRARFVAIVGLAAAVGWPVFAAARPGDIDTTFGARGKTSLPIDLVTDIKVDANARILVAGIVFDTPRDPGPRDPPNPRMNTFVARMEPDGSLDPTFGRNGLAAIDPDSDRTFFGQLATQPDGSVLVAAVSSLLVEGRSVSALTVTRLDERGQPDETFAKSAGRVIVTLHSGTFGLPGIFVRANGDFTVATVECGVDDCRLVTVRATAHGVPRGAARIDELTDFLGGSVVQAEGGGFLLGGEPRSGDDGAPLVLARRTALGEPDKRYPRNGRTQTSLRLPLLGNWPALVLDAADRPIALGSHRTQIEARRFQPSGDPDPLFAPTVIAPPDAGESRPNSVALQPDGRIIVAGTSGDLPLGLHCLLAMLGPDGGLERSFGNDGIVALQGDGSADAFAIQPDGRIVVACDDVRTTSLVRLQGSSRECGDATGDGHLTVTDGVQVLRAATDLPSSCLVDFCDADASGVVTVTDGVRTLRAAAGLVTDLRCAR